MKTYTYRNARRERLSVAIAALTLDQIDLRNILNAEQTALQTDDWTVTDNTFEAIAANWIWHNFTMLKTLVDQDPVLVALSITSSLKPSHIFALSSASFPHPALPPNDYLKKVLIAVDSEQTIFTELVHAAHQAWFKMGVENAAYPLDDVGVLLPLRFETLFDAPASRNNEDPGKWKISIRVIPDEASICRDNAFVSPDEIKALVAFWQSVKQAGNVSETWLDGDQANVAWKQLSNRVRAERAAWLVANIEVKIQNDTVELVLPDDMPAAPMANRVGGMPPELNVFAVTTDVINGTDHFLIGRLPMDENSLIDPAQLVLPLPSDLIMEKDSWWASWEKAKAVGLGGEYLIPAGITPENIDALYVVGIGDETPNAHFAAQVNSGELSIPRLGDATNSIKGSNTHDEIDWQKVGRTRLAKIINPVPEPLNTGSKMQLHLTGLPDSLPFFPGSAAPDDTLPSQQLVKALWPALWGNWLHEIWNGKEGAFRRGLWAFDNLCPEGPLMPLRIGDEPYGLLPVTSLRLWEAPEAVDPETAAQSREETAMVKLFHNMRSQYAKAARGKGSVVGKTSEEFMELLSQDALNHCYIKRRFYPFSTPMALYQLNAARQKEFRDKALLFYKAAIDLMGTEPTNIYVGISEPERLSMPLVQSTRSLYRHQNGQNRSPLALLDLILILIHFLERNDLEGYDLELVFKKFHILNHQGEFQIASLPNSLLIRLLIYSCQATTLWQHDDPNNSVLRRVVDIQQKQAQSLAQLIDQQPLRQKVIEPVSGNLHFQSIIPPDQLKELERTFCATLDSAANRIDPWITGFAWQRLKLHSQSSQHNHRLGAYGWVDGPFIGQPGPTDSGLLHTPSYNQTLAALIMRDKLISARRTNTVNETAQSPWQMNITSKKVRIAEEIAEEVRMGFHIYEVIGRHIENIVAHPIKVRELRSNPKYSMRTERNDPHEVCDGNKALPELLKGDINFPMNAAQQEALHLLKDSLDTYSDLLMGDGVIQLINRQPERAAETMDAAAGFSRPPAFEFIRTPPSGYQLETVVLSILPFISIENLAGDTHPIRLADPSVAAFIENKLGNDWVWNAVNDDDGSLIGSVSLPELNLSSLDTLAVSDEFIKELIRYKLGLPIVYITKGNNRRWEVFDLADNFLGSNTIITLKLDPGNLPEQESLNTLISSNFGLPGDTVIKETVPDDLELWVAKNEKGIVLGVAVKSDLEPLPAIEDELNKKVRHFLGIPKVRIDAAREHQLAQQLVASLGNRPAAGRDLTDNKAAPAVTDSSIYGELAKRYTAIANACQLLITKLKNVADDANRLSALREAVAWGVMSAVEPADREVFLSALAGIELPVIPTRLSDLANNVISVLEKRLQDAVKPEELANELEISSPLTDHRERKQANKPDGVPSLARAIANLASPNTKLAILACWDKTSIVNNTGIVADQSEAIEEEWLTVIASVRSTLARLEALQLEIAEPLLSWTNSPNDPWRTGDENIINQNLLTRDTQSVVKMQMTRFVAAYGTEATWLGDKIAVGLIDAFSESIPMPHRKTMTAFGFNAPSSRAPQAILLAVPPKPRQRLDAKLLLNIIEETRSLAHARTARPEDLKDLQVLSSTMWFQGSGVARVRLEPGPLFVV